MPTAGRLIGGLAFAILGAWIAFATGPLFEEGREPGFWLPLCAACGLWAGWVVVGRRAGNGYSGNVGVALTGVVSQCFWILFILSAYDMVQKSMRRSYDGPVEAVINVFELGAEYALQFATSDVLIGLLVGGIIAGLVTEFFARRYP